MGRKCFLLTVIHSYSQSTQLDFFSYFSTLEAKNFFKEVIFKLSRDPFKTGPFVFSNAVT